MKVKIYGSCVSRDAIEFDFENNFELISCFARSSMATLHSANIGRRVSKDNYKCLSNIDSKYQRRMVEYDFNNKVIESVISEDYDILLIDLIDERFHLAEVNSKFITRSSEFLRSGIRPQRLVDTFSNEYLELWYKGVDNLLKSIDNTVGLNKIKLSKVFWTDISTNDNDTSKIRLNTEVTQRPKQTLYYHHE